MAIAAITSCTNTSNPMVMLGAGLLAKKAVERGLSVNPAVKTSLAPGSRVVTDYLERAGLMPYLEALQFHVVGYGCTTCIGNSGPLPEAVAAGGPGQRPGRRGGAERQSQLRGAHPPQVRASYLASPPLVVAFALAGTVDIDLTTDPIGHDPNGNAVYLRDLWPTQAEIREAMEAAVGPGPVPQGVRRGLRRRRALAGAAAARDGRPVRVGSAIDLRPGAAVLRRPDALSRRR